MKTFDGLVAWKKTIGFHRKFFCTYLHGKSGTQVKYIGVANIGKKKVGKTIWIFIPKMIKFCLPVKINKVLQCAGWFNPVIIEFKMIPVKKFDVLHYFYLIREGNFQCNVLGAILDERQYNYSNQGLNYTNMY